MIVFKGLKLSIVNAIYFIIYILVYFNKKVYITKTKSKVNRTSTCPFAHNHTKENAYKKTFNKKYAALSAQYNKLTTAANIKNLT